MSLFMSDAVSCVQRRLMSRSGSYYPVLKQIQWLFTLQTFPELWSVLLTFFTESKAMPLNRTWSMQPDHV